MKSLKTIANEATSKDSDFVAEVADCSYKNVRQVITEKRKDHYNIQKIYSEFLIMKDAFMVEAKEILTKKYRKNKNKEI